MALAKTQRLTRHTYGDDGAFGKRNIVSTSFSATDLGKAVVANTNSILASSPAGTYFPVPNPAVPRNLSVTASAGTGSVTITGKNSEGANITETFTITNTSTVAGLKAFAIVSTVVIGAGITATVGVGAKFGLGVRSINAGSIAKILVIPANGIGGTLENASASTSDGTLVENNTITPTTAPDGAKQFRLYVLDYSWHVDPLNGNPVYGV